MTMAYRFINQDSKRTIVLLHGTGGDESELIFLGQTIDKSANLLGIRGRININGMHQFYNNDSHGFINPASMVDETKYLHKYLQAFAKVNQLDPKEMIILGQSNGANIIASLIYHFGNFYKAYILLQAKVPLKDFEICQLSKTRILMTNGKKNQYVTLDQTQALYDVLNKHGAEVTLKIHSFDHLLSQKEIKTIKSWYKKTAIRN